MSPGWPRRFALAALVGLGFATLAATWQLADGVYRSELGSHPDEAAHFVTGLMVRDYIASGIPRSPMAFASDYYKNYPKIGLGVWPPFFYLAQSAATLSLGDDPRVVLALLAALAGGLAAWVARGVSQSGGWVAGLLAGACLLGLPDVQRHYGMIMAETLSALLFFGAATRFGQFIENGKRREAVWFGLLASLAILTKGTGLALVPVPLLAALLAGRPRVLLRKSTWLSALVVVVIAGPWTWMTREMGHGGWIHPHPTFSFTGEALPYYLAKLVIGVGWPTLIAAALGVALRWVASRRLSGREAAWAATALSVILFQSILPVGLEARHLVPAAPCLIALAFGGGSALAAMPFVGDPVAKRVLSPVWCGLLAALVIGLGVRLQEKDWAGFAPAATLLIERSGPAEELLVSSDASGEGMLIAAVASGDHRPGRFVQRASKLLSGSTWSGAGYTSHFESAAAVRDCLASSRIRFVALDDSVPKRNRRAHHELLAEAMRGGGLFEEIWSGDAVRGGKLWPRAIRVFERAK